MTTATPYDKLLLDIGYGLKIGLKRQTVWQVWAKNGGVDLHETLDFHRVLVLLEKSFSEAEALLHRFADTQRAANKFPLWRVVGAGLACESELWASLALQWWPHLSAGERAMLRDPIGQVVEAKWASQKSRQLTDRFARQLDAETG